MWLVVALVLAQNDDVHIPRASLEDDTTSAIENISITSSVSASTRIQIVTKNEIPSTLPQPSVFFRRLSGANSCRITDNCVSVGFEGLYSNSERCIIEVLANGKLTSRSFNTEPYYDFVTIANIQYSGTTGLSNISVSRGDTFTWFTDENKVASGWTICLQTDEVVTSPSTVSPSTSSVPLVNATARDFRIHSGGSNCVVHGNCVLNLNYQNSEECDIEVLQYGTLSNDAFDTEACCDHLDVGNHRFSGQSGPSDLAVAPGTRISWRSDSSITQSGWTICLQPREALVVVEGNEHCLVNGDCVSDVSYGNSESCRIAVLESGTLSSTHFETENGFDHITIGSTTYSGIAGPDQVAVAANTQFFWNSDSSITASGWTVCLDRSGVQDAPMPLSRHAAAPLQLLSGEGVCEINGNCVESLNYGNREHCRIRVAESGQLSSPIFNTESCCDVVDVDGQSYSGSDGPQMLPVSENTEITWNTDGSVVRSGWRMCLDPTNGLVVTNGSQYCHQHGNCVTNVNYGNNEDCSVQVLAHGRLSSTSFGTERGFDMIWINGVGYSGRVGPSQVPVVFGSTFSWRSDSSITGTGWTICLTAGLPAAEPDILREDDWDETMYWSWVVGMLCGIMVLLCICCLSCVCHYRLKLLKLQRETSHATGSGTICSRRHEQNVNAPPAYQTSISVKSDAEHDPSDSKTSMGAVVQETDIMNTESEL